MADEQERVMEARRSKRPNLGKPATRYGYGDDDGKGAEERAESVTTTGTRSSGDSVGRYSARRAVLEAERRVAEKELQLAKLAEEVAHSERSASGRFAGRSTSPKMQREVFAAAGELMDTDTPDVAVEEEDTHVATVLQGHSEVVEGQEVASTMGAVELAVDPEPVEQKSHAVDLTVDLATSGSEVESETKHAPQVDLHAEIEGSIEDSVNGTVGAERRIQSDTIHGDRAGVNFHHERQEYQRKELTYQREIGELREQLSVAKRGKEEAESRGRSVVVSLGLVKRQLAQAREEVRDQVEESMRAEEKRRSAQATIDEAVARAEMIQLAFEKQAGEIGSWREECRSLRDNAEHEQARVRALEIGLAEATREAETWKQLFRTEVENKVQRDSHVDPITANTASEHMDSAVTSPPPTRVAAKRKGDLSSNVSECELADREPYESEPLDAPPTGSTRPSCTDTEVLADEDVSAEGADSQRPVPKPRVQQAGASGSARQQFTDLATELVGALSKALRGDGGGTAKADESSAAGLKQLAARQTATTSKLPTFSGRPEEWPAFISLYKSTTKQCGFSDAENAQRLQVALKGSAKEAVQLVLAVPGNVNEAIRTLERRFGRPELVIAELIAKAKELKPFRADDIDALLSFTTAVNNIVMTMKLLNSQGHQTNPALRSELVAKLPMVHKMQWGEFLKASGLSTDQLQLSTFAKWLTERAEAVALAAPPRTAATQSAVPKKAIASPAFQGPTKPVAAPRASKPCKKCQGDHALYQCKDFTQLTVGKRLELVRQLGLCHNCLQSGHWARDCTASRCRKCSGRHNTLLHLDRTNDNRNGSHHGDQQRAGPTPTARACNAAHSALTTTTALMTTVAKVRCGDTEIYATVMLDSGSTCSFVTADMAKRLQASPREVTRMCTTVLGGGELQHVSAAIQLELCHDDDTEDTTQLTAMELPNITAPVQPINWDTQKLEWEHLRDLDLRVPNDSTIDLLIGLDAPLLHATLDERRGPEGSPIARKTPLGWICFGPSGESAMSDGLTGVATTQAPEATKPTLEQMVRSIYSLEVEPAQAAEHTMSKDELEAERLTDTSLQINNGRVKVSIPWTNASGGPDIKSNRAMAEQRLHSLQRSLARKPSLGAAYSEVFQKYLAKGYIREVSADEVEADGDTQWFLPHFPVVREDRSTTKVRVVFDAAAKSNDRCVNDAMYAGPALQNNITQCLLKFCKEPIAMSADIQEMFLQVELDQPDRKFHRFLWQTDGPVRVYEFNRLCFGIKASPYLATKAVRAASAHFSRGDTEVATTVAEDLYVDDLLTSVSTPEAGIKLRTDLQDTLEQGGFHLRKWISTSATVLDTIPEEDRAESAVINLGHQQHVTLPSVKTLGVSWSASEDVFTFRYGEPEIDRFTKRTVLGKLATIFDPRGQVSPYTIRGKVLFQDLCLQGLDWDEQFDDTTTAKWQRFFRELPSLAEVRAQRSFKDPQQTEEPRMSLHTFVDASDCAVAAAVYVRAEYPTHVRVTLAMSKARTAPLHRQSIPMLELRAAVLGTEITQQVRAALDIEEVQYWSDSMNVLYWLRSHSRRFKVEVGNRISKVQALSKPEQWRHVPTAVNPADKGTRGMSAAELARDDRWWHGPAFLAGPASEFPQRAIDIPSSLPAELKKRSAMSFVATEVESRLQPSKFSSWKRLARVTAWCRRFLQAASKGRICATREAEADTTPTYGTTKPARSDDTTEVKPLSVAEIETAESYWIQRAQQETFKTTRVALKRGVEPGPSDPLLKLRPQLETINSMELMTVGGRLSTAHHLQRSTRHPIILSGKHAVTRLIIQQEDDRCGHAVGPNHLLANLSRRFWIVKGKSVVRSHRHHCPRCRRMWAKPVTPLMGTLPTERTEGPLMAFNNVAVDYAGPFYTRQGRGRSQMKRYVCVFTCIQTRACHLEMVHSLDTDGFLMAFSRFCQRRGIPKLVRSDNGSNFVAAERELRQAYEKLNFNEITSHMSQQRVQWEFNPPRSPHFGGIVECIVKMVKRAIWHVLHKADLTDEELLTAIVQAEGMLNTRPLTVVSSDAMDLEPLTPNHFIIGRAAAFTHLEVAMENVEKANPRRRWQLLQTLMKQVWKRWLHELVPLLNLRSKWHRDHPNVNVDDVFIVVDEDMPRATWPLGRVVKVYPGKDDVVRAVDVQIRGKVYRRAVHRLIPLEVAPDKTSATGHAATAEVDMEDITG